MAPEVCSGQAVPWRALPGERERSIVLAARRGDANAFRELYRAYRDPVWTLIVSLVGDPSQAQDVMQNVFFKAFRGLGGFRFQSGLFTWIYRIAHNECLNHLRRREIPHVPLEAIVGNGHEHEIDKARVSDLEEARRDALRDAVKQLPFKMREVVVLKYVEDLSYTEMSRILGCPPGTVASRLNRALSGLEMRLRPFKGLP